MTLRVLSVPVVAAIVLLGTWVTGGLITDDFETSVALNTAFFAAAGAAVLVIARRRRDLRVPVVATFVVAATAVGGYLAYGTFVDKTVNEAVARGPAEASGTFRSLAHETTGTVRVVGGELQLVGLATDPGPDLRVYLTRERYDGGGVGAHVDLGALKGNRGTQRYDLPQGTFASVVIWCRAFSVALGAADLDG
jgi:Electron transfer DM13